MVNFNNIDTHTFLTEYWQKKPLLIKKALPDFKPLLSPDELAGLSMEEDIESRMVFSTPNQAPFWHLKRGPFLETDFQKLPKTHWTLLVQGVDRFIPELALLFDHFNFIPQWRVDDLMISYAAQQGSVGPHYDHYDVFLYQAKGSRKWSLTTRDCNESNSLPDVPLRIMKNFDIEETYLLEEGDMLYLPPNVGHYGIAVDDGCMTYSFGYRSYADRELWDSYGDFCAEMSTPSVYYRDPNWSSIQNSAELSPEAWFNAKQTLMTMLNDEQRFKSWFGRFVTQLDQQAYSLLPEKRSCSLAAFLKKTTEKRHLTRNPLVRFAYYLDNGRITLYVNGEEWHNEGVSVELIQLIASQRRISTEQLSPWVSKVENQDFLHQLWKLQIFSYS